jgi:hypothetical protein
LGLISFALEKRKEHLMKLLSLVLAIFFSLIALPQLASTQTQPKPEELAQKAAEEWLALTDSGKYGESWEQACAAFRDKISKDEWVGKLTSDRTPLGKVQSRKLTAARYIKDPPNSPAGEYVVLKYATDFESKPDSVETVAMVLDKDGKWRTTGYFIK